MTNNRLVLIALVSALSMVAFSCGGSSDDEEGGDSGNSTASKGSITSDKLPSVGVQLSDLPSGYAPKTGYPKQLTSPSDCVSALGSGLDSVQTQLQSLGLEGCYLSVFTEEKGNDANSPGSGSYLFKDAEVATKALPILRSAGVQSLKPTGGATVDSTRDVPVTGLGDQSEPGVTTTLAVGARKFAISLYFWRSSNVVVYAGGGDSLGDFNEKSYLDLSKKVASRAGA